MTMLEDASSAAAADGSRWSDLSLLINGRLVAGRGPMLAVENPATEETIAQVRTADSAQLEAAVGAARRAFDDGPWSRLSPDERRAAIHRFADVFDTYAKRFTDAIIAELGTPVAIAEPLQVSWPAQHLRWYADQAAVDRTERLGPHENPVRSESEVGYRPVGVVAAISAYNYPLTLAVHKIGPALATGCTVVLIGRLPHRRRCP